MVDDNGDDGDDSVPLEIFDDPIETGEPDPRQESFLKTMATMAQEGFVPIGMEGFRASHIDIGWISEKILDHVIVNPGIEPDELAELLRDELPRIIQRLKRLAIDTEDWPDSIEIELETKDDHGTYHYRFTAPVD